MRFYPHSSTKTHLFEVVNVEGENSELLGLCTFISFATGRGNSRKL